MISSRQKSCSACVQGKRRCDLGFPYCGRCLARRVTCVYAWISPEEAEQVAFATDSGLWAPQDVSFQYLHQNGFLSHHVPRPRECHANNEITSYPAPMTTSPALACLLDKPTGSFALGPQLQFVDNPYPDDALITHAPQSLHITSTLLEPFSGSNSSSIITDKSFQPRAKYAASRLVRQVRTLAETGQTSFIHSSQVGDSAILREAFTASSLYTTRNPVNESLVLSEIARRAEVLVGATETAISLMLSSQSAMDLDLLHAVQAMLVYQCIRLFTAGDIAHQTQAEVDAKSLARWVDILNEQTKWSPGNLSTGEQFSLSAWKDWVRAESIQRTIIFAEVLDGIYTFLRFGWYQPSAKMANLGFVGQVDVWEARSLAEWCQARQKPWVELNTSTFHDGIKEVSTKDLDELGVIILVSYVGVEVLEEWAGGDERLLDKWGLSSNIDFFSLCY